MVVWISSDNYRDCFSREEFIRKRDAWGRWDEGETFDQCVFMVILFANRRLAATVT